jgi:biofilm PGA synthesis N-glycosyltransferase PgaC
VTDELARFFGLDALTLLPVFWYALLLEVPRFVIAVLYVAAREVMSNGPQFPPIDPSKPACIVPTISVLLVGHNEGRALQRAVLGLHEQLLRPTQIVVVDDGSSDDMPGVGRKLKARGLIDAFVSIELRGGKAAAQNLGLTYCTADIVVIADIDTSFDRDALNRLIEPFADPRVGAVSGNLAVRNVEASLLTRFQAIQYLNSIAMGRRINDMLFGLFIASGAFAAFRREALESVGGWMAGPGEDGDITTRVRRAGWAVRFQPDAWALTDVPETLTALFRQQTRWNRSFAMLRFRKHLNILNPFQAHFSIVDALGTIDILFFEAVRPALFCVYSAALFDDMGSLAWPILLGVVAFYMAARLALTLAAIVVSWPYGRWDLLLYVPGATVFHALVMRPAALYGFLTELLLRWGYRDSFVPRRVLDGIHRF